MFKNVVVAGLALEWAWQHGSTNLRCVFVSRDPEISRFLRTDGHG